MSFGIVRELIFQQPIRAARGRLGHDRLELVPDVAGLTDAVERNDEISFVILFGVIAIYVCARLAPSHPGIVMLEYDRSEYRGASDDGGAEEPHDRGSSGWNGPERSNGDGGDQ